MKRPNELSEGEQIVVRQQDTEIAIIFARNYGLLNLYIGPAGAEEMDRRFISAQYDPDTEHEADTLFTSMTYGRDDLIIQEE